jgi:YesN/AraC family two-component response regulator
MSSIQELVKFTKTLKLLVVEDNEDSREQFVGMLSALFDNIDAAVDGLDGLEKFNNNSYDLIISDINMPKMNGLEMVEEIRKKDKDITIMVVSAHTEGNFRTEAEALEVNNFLFKPIDLQPLIAALTDMMQRA